MRDRLAILAIAIALAVVMSACGAPTAGTTGTAARARARAPRRLTLLPPRPREIDLTGVDTCTLLTPEQQKQIGNDHPPEFTKISRPLRQSTL